MRIPTSKQDKGFTLIELLVVIVIIGILAAIAIPVFLNQREKAVEASIKSDLKNAATAEEAYLVDNNQYSTAVTSLPGFKGTSGVTITATLKNGGYCLSGAKSATGSPVVFHYDSLNGGLKPGAPVSGTGTAC